jgi:LysR family glycine cleavage system transcriptional activator
MQALEMALRTGSLKAAAEHMSISPAAVGQRIKQLEDFLGLPLLERGRSGLRASAALARAQPHLESAFRELAIVKELLDLQRGHEFHIAVAPDFAELWLQPRLPEFAAQFPNLLIDVNVEGSTPARHGRVDCEIVFGPMKDGRSKEQNIDTLFRDFVLPISSPEMDRRVANRRERDRLEGLALFHVDFYKDDPQVPNWPMWVKSEGHRRSAPSRGIRFAHIAQAIETVANGAGFALCGVALARGHLDAGKLSLPFGVSSGRWTSHAFHVRIPSAALLRPQVRRFRQWLLEEAGSTERWLLDQFGAANGT